MTTSRKNAQDNTVSNCLLYDSGCSDRNGKSEAFCKKCGWDVKECKRRKQLIRYGHLTADRYGCKRLILSEAE